MTASKVDTVVVGGGQAGLCMSYYLSRYDIPHVVLERGRVAERWRSERWDSLRFQFPNRYVRLPGFDYNGEDPEGFMDHKGVVDVVERYAQYIRAPLRCGVNVRSLRQAADGGFKLQAGGAELLAGNVVLATGPYQHTLIPPVSTQLPQHIVQLPASSFTNAAALPPGGVLVVGAGGSGVQIAEDLLAAGRQVWLCVGKHKRVPRRYRGRDIMDWLEQLELISQPSADRDPSDHSPLLTGVDGGYEVDLRRLVAQGAHLLGRLEGVHEGKLRLGDKLLADIAAADEAYNEFVNGVETVLAARGEADGEPPAPPPAPGPLPQPPPLELDMHQAGISSVIWATGYRVDFSWVHCGEYEDDGMPVQQRGVSTVPGLYFLGLAFLYNARSSFFWGVGEDAGYIADHLRQRRVEAGA